MTGKELFIGLGSIDEEFYAEAEKDFSRAHRPILIAAIIAAVLLLAGCGCYVLSEAEWFQSYFSNKQGHSLSQGQSDYIAQNTHNLGQSVTVNGYTLTVESAIAESRLAYIKLRLEGEKPMNAEHYDFRPRPLADGSGYEQFFYEKGKLASAYSGYGAGTRTEEDGPNENAIYILIQLDQSINPQCPSFEAGMPYVLHLTDLYATDTGGSSTLVAEGVWDFEIVFGHLNSDALELIINPVTVTFQDISLRLTSLKLRTMGADAGFDPADDRGIVCLVFANVVLKDGTSVSLNPSTYDPGGRAGLTLDSPIALDEVDFVELRDGTRIPMP